jgi:hypothetical protein
VGSSPFLLQDVLRNSHKGIGLGVRSKVRASIFGAEVLGFPGSKPRQCVKMSKLTFPVVLNLVDIRVVQ